MSRKILQVIKELREANKRLVSENELLRLGQFQSYLHCKRRYRERIDEKTPLTIEDYKALKGYYNQSNAGKLQKRSDGSESRSVRFKDHVITVVFKNCIPVTLRRGDKFEYEKEISKNKSNSLVNQAKELIFNYNH